MCLGWVGPCQARQLAIPGKAASSWPILHPYSNWIGTNPNRKGMLSRKSGASLLRTYVRCMRHEPLPFCSQREVYTPQRLWRCVGTSTTFSWAHCTVAAATWSWTVRSGQAWPKLDGSTRTGRDKTLTLPNASHKALSYWVNFELSWVGIIGSPMGMTVNGPESCSSLNPIYVHSGSHGRAFRSDRIYVSVQNPNW